MGETVYKVMWVSGYVQSDFFLCLCRKVVNATYCMHFVLKSEIACGSISKKLTLTRIQHWRKSICQVLEGRI